MNVTLIGMKHCGKSTLGAALSARWGCPFYDVDKLIEEHNACEGGGTLSVREIFKQHGETRFVELETTAVCDLYLRLADSTENHVISVGGRTALNPRVDELLAALGLIVYLEVSPEEMFARVQRTGIPAFVDQADPAKHFQELFQQRDPHYRRLANLIVNLNGLDPVAALNKLCIELNRHNQAQSR
jgi:shikimate kinase